MNLGDQLNLATRIVGGQTAEIKDYPYVVYVRLMEVNKEQMCAGSIIGFQWILTAAHCFEYDFSIYF